MITLNEKGIKVGKKGKEKAFLTNGTSIYLTAMKTDFSKVFDRNGRKFTLKLSIMRD